jgi:hypothetical protein
VRRKLQPINIVFRTIPVVEQALRAAMMKLENSRSMGSQEHIIPSGLLDAERTGSQHV